VVPSKRTRGDSWRADLLVLPGNRSQPGGTRKSGSLEKSAAAPLRTRFPLAASRGERARPGGHEENWFLRKKYGTCWWGLIPGFRSEQRE
jgi:hypothetical protein